MWFDFNVIQYSINQYAIFFLRLVWLLHGCMKVDCMITGRSAVNSLNFPFNKQYIE